MADLGQRASLTDEQREILRFLAPAHGEGWTLAHDIATECGLSPRGIGQKLRALERLGLVERAYVADAQPFGWQVTWDGWKVA